MGNKVKAIIFDWGRTLHDPETDALFPGVPELLNNLSQHYTLALISLAKSDSPAERKQKIEESGIGKYFKLILVGGEDKDEMYEQTLTDLNLTQEEIVVVDDRTARGIAWGNHRGAMTIWLKKGKFADELPTEKTGQPTYTIGDIRELEDIFKNLNI